MNDSATSPPVSGRSAEVVDAERETGPREVVAAPQWRTVSGGFGSVVGLSLILAFTRQLFWFVSRQPLAWALAAALALAIGLAIRRTLPPAEPLPTRFWLLVGLPLLAVWALRLPLVDLSWDVLNYHLLHAERALRGPMWVPGDFFPHYLGFVNPAPDIATGLFRHLLGYRAGTLLELLALVWTAHLVWRLLGLTTWSATPRCLATLAVVAWEGTLTQLATYMIDVLALPLLLLVLLLLVTAEADARPGPLHLVRLPLVALLLGAVLGLKLTQLAVIGPLGLVAVVLLLRRARGLGPRRVAVSLLLAGVFFAAPLAVHTGLLAQRFGSPLFPHYNRIFQSPHFPQSDIRDRRWGPSSTGEALFWPATSIAHPERVSELAAASGRMPLVWTVAWLALAVAPISSRARRLAPLSFTAAAGGLLWSLSTGYARYGLGVELVGGVLVVVVAADLLAQRRPVGRAAGGLLIVALALQSLASFGIAWRHDWGGRPPVTRLEPGVLRAEASLVLRDRDLATFLPTEVKAAIGSPAAWVDASPKVNGVMALLAPEAPMILVRKPAYFQMEANRPLLASALRVASTGRVVSLAYPDDRDHWLRTLAGTGFAVRSIEAVEVPFFSVRRGLHLLVATLQPPPPEPGTVRPEKLPGEVGAIESAVREGSGALRVRGWARSPGEDLHVSLRVDGRAREAFVHRRVPRPDLALSRPELGDCATAGFEIVVSLKGRPGTRVSAVLRTPDGMGAARNARRRDTGALSGCRTRPRRPGPSAGAEVPA